MPSAWGWGVDGVTGLEGNFLGIYPYQKANLGVGGLVLVGTWIHTDAASPGSSECMCEILWVFWAVECCFHH